MAAVMVVGLWLGVSTCADGAESTLSIPVVRGTSFGGQAVNLPMDLKGRVGVLVVGFSQGSRNAVKDWGLRLSADYEGSPVVMFYEMPMLAEVPRLLRGYVTAKIKDSVSERARPHFVPIVENEAGWRTITGYAGGNDAYAVVVDTTGVVRWQTHEKVTDRTYLNLKQAVESARSGIGH
jgi:hypothetical protein